MCEAMSSRRPAPDSPHTNTHIRIQRTSSCSLGPKARPMRATAARTTASMGAPGPSAGSAVKAGEVAGWDLGADGPVGRAEAEANAAAGAQLPADHDRCWRAPGNDEDSWC